MPKVQTIRRISNLERAATPPKAPRVWVFVGADEPRHPGEIVIGGWPDGEGPAPYDHVLQVHYEQTRVTNRAALASPGTPAAAAPVVEADNAPPAPVQPTGIDPHSRIGRAYRLDRPWRLSASDFPE